MARHSPPALPPAWVVVLGSVLVLVHLFCALASALNTFSGPWAMLGGNAGSEALAPQFAISSWSGLAEYYQRYVKVTSPFRFSSLRQEMLEINAEAVLKDEAGKVIDKVKLPDPEASSAMQYRQRLLAQQLGNDIPLPPQQGVVIAPEGQKLPTIRYWVNETDHRLVLKEDNPNAVPRNQSFMQPSTWQYIVAKSYVRYLNRQQPKAKVELVRSWYDPVNPIVLIEQEAVPAEMLRGFTSSYGELRP